MMDVTSASDLESRKAVRSAGEYLEREPDVDAMLIRRPVLGRRRGRKEVEAERVL
jgi:hypothetical protein